MYLKAKKGEIVHVGASYKYFEKPEIPDSYLVIKYDGRTPVGYKFATKKEIIKINELEFLTK
jgi:hypothetical protein